MSLLLSFRSEMLKTRRTASFYLALVAGAFGPVMSMLDLGLDGVPPEHQYNMIEEMFATKFQPTGFALLPMFLMLVCTLLPQIEFKNNAWKQVLSSPQTKLNIFLAKFLNVQFLVLVFLLTNKLLTGIDLVILHFMNPSLNILHQHFSWYTVLMPMVNSYVCLLALCALQFWMGIRFRNFIAPIAVGMACWFGGSLMVMEYHSPAGPYFPYSFQAYSTFSQYAADLDGVRWMSVIYAVLFMTLAFMDFRRKRMS